jgi:hypothetical protein
VIVGGPDFDTTSLEQIVEHCKRNIKALEDEVARKQADIIEWENLKGKGQFDDAALERGIEGLRADIAKIRIAIESEHELIKSRRMMIEQLEHKKMVLARAEAAQANLQIVAKHAKGRQGLD